MIGKPFLFGLFTIPFLPDECISTDKIVGGTPASAGEFPGYAIPDDGDLCGAYLIKNNILLSAAHCAGAFQGHNVRIGGLTRTGPGATETIAAIEECIHPSYNDETIENDIMLVRLQTPSSQAVKDYYKVSE
jgi:secreted trypsin-like serine protease